MSDDSFNIKIELKKLPTNPGVYLMKNNKDEIIYVGKAKNLKNRVNQYFNNSSNKTYKTEKMVPNIKEFEYIITDSEDEALILECNLIKKNKPRYNILLKDDKSYPFIKVTTNEFYPRIFATRSYKRDKCKYFGPYTDLGYMKVLIDICQRLYKLRKCKLNLKKTGNNFKPCLNYHINLCDAPCIDNISYEDYQNKVNKVIRFLEGNIKEVMMLLQEEMKKYVSEQNFEDAGKIRDFIMILKDKKIKQKMQQDYTTSQDIIAFSNIDKEWIAQIFFVREGKILGKEHYFIKNTGFDTKEEIINDYIKQYYIEATMIPKEIIIENEIVEKDTIEDLLSYKAGYKVNILVPTKGKKKKLLVLAKQNARITLEQVGNKLKKEKESSQIALRQLKDLLKVNISLNRIESYDISNIQGVYNVGAMVVYENGIKKPSDYRKFKIKTVYGADDYSSMMEVVKRRFKRYYEKNEKFYKIPELIMVDGGKGQVNVVKRVLDDYGLNIMVCGLVKDSKHRTRGIIYENNEIKIDVKSELFKFITRIQDEVHRFAIEYFRKTYSNNQFNTVLDKIEGIGDVRKIRLLKKFKTIDGIRKATVEELMQVDGMNFKAANNVYIYLQKHIRR